MKERKRMLSITITKPQTWHKIFEIVNQNGDVISWIELCSTYNENSFTDSVDVFIKLRMTFNSFYQHTKQELNSADFLFENLTQTLSYDISEVLNVDESRINDILPINIKLQRVEKENVVCRKNLL